MSSHQKKIRLAENSDLAAIADEVCEDKQPRFLERDGRDVAVVVSVDEFVRLQRTGPSSDGIRRALDAAGSWSDMHGDDLIERIYEARHEAPPRRRVEW